jgi:predicted TIM-barrel fold metal-dependent hydrolase
MVAGNRIRRRRSAVIELGPAGADVAGPGSARVATGGGASCVAKAEYEGEGRTLSTPALTVVDADVHPYPRSAEEMEEYTPEPWRSRDFRPKEPASRRQAQLYPSPHGHGARVDTLPPDGSPASSDPDFTRRQLLERADVQYAILIPLGPRPDVNSEHDAATCQATNDWLADTWLSKYNKDDLYRGTLRVPTGDPVLAAREIDRWTGDSRFVQVMLDPGHQQTLGQPYFDPVYEAAQRAGIAVSVHPIKGSGMRFLTPVGYPSYFMDQHSQLALICAAQLTSLVCEGTFEKFPDLRFAFIEGGFGWAIPLMWRLDNYWKEIPDEIPLVKRPPSSYIAEHVHFTTQPFEDPGRMAQLSAIIEFFEEHNMLMFSTDYPHWDADDPQWLVKRLPASVRKDVLVQNALHFYKLPAKPARTAEPVGSRS